MINPSPGADYSHRASGAPSVKVMTSDRKTTAVMQEVPLIMSSA